MEKTYKFRLYPSKQEAELLNKVLDSCRYLYNSQLEYEKFVYEKDKRFANRIELNNLLPDLKIINPNFKKIHSQVLQNVNDRVIKSFDGFFGRVQKGQTAGYPRFKNSFRYNSFSYPQSGFNISKNKLKLSKIGKITIKLHRQIRGEVKTLTIIKTPTNNWYACFCVQEEIVRKNRQIKNVVGIDLGIEYFATLSDKNIIQNNRYLKKSLNILQIRSRQLSKKKKGSNNRTKARQRLANLHEKVAYQRMDFLHKETRKLVTKYDAIALEDLKVSSMKDKHLQFSINDVSWNKFRQLLVYKAEEAGCKLDFQNPRNTSKRCCSCGQLQDMPLSKRVFSCRCGNTMARDLNSAINILNKSCFSSV